LNPRKRASKRPVGCLRGAHESLLLALLELKPTSLYKVGPPEPKPPAGVITLLEIAANPKHLGARIGVLAVLHTWGQKLTLHPHLRCIVPGGGLSIDGDW
jgi:putative transposase